MTQEPTSALAPECFVTSIIPVVYLCHLFIIIFKYQVCVLVPFYMWALDIFHLADRCGGLSISTPAI